MKQLYPDLWQTQPERPVPSEPEATAHAYLLVRDGGGILFYSNGREAIDQADDEADLRQIEELGGITHQLLAHWHEASSSLPRIKQRFDAALGVHERDAAAVRKASGIGPDLPLQARETLLGDIEVIPTPGHTAGSTCFRYRSPHGRTYLFTGDTIVPNRDSWMAAAFEDDAGQPRLRKSLELLREVDPDVILAAGALGSDTCREVSPASWRSALDAATASLS